MQQTGNVGRQIAVLARLWRTELDNRLRPLGLSQARWILLVHLSEAKAGISQLHLADRAGVTGATLVRQIDQLELAGLVERREDPEDRRVKRVLLTDAGRRKFHQVDAVAGALRREVLEDAEPDDVDALLRLSARLIGRFEALSPNPAKGAA